VKIRFCYLSVFLSLLLILPLAQGFSKDKITVAVLDFEAKNISKESAEAVTDLLRTELFNTGRFKVVEREKIRRIIDEHSFQSSGMTDSDRAVEIGRLLNAEKIMVGTVTKLGNTRLINTRMVDVQSGLVVLAESVKSMGGEDQLPTAITELAMSIAFKVGLEGAIIRIEGEQVFMDLGKGDGVNVGQVFRVLRPGEAIADLEGRIIGTQNELIGAVKVTKVQDRFCIAEISEKNRPLQRGDMVKPVEGEDWRKYFTAKKEDEKKRDDKTSDKKEDDKKKPDVPVVF
jgi:TolB-like protein